MEINIELNMTDEELQDDTRVNSYIDNGTYELALLETEPYMTPDDVAKCSYIWEIKEVLVAGDKAYKVGDKLKSTIEPGRTFKHPGTKIPKKYGQIDSKKLAAEFARAQDLSFANTDEKLSHITDVVNGRAPIGTVITAHGKRAASGFVNFEPGR